MKIWEQCTNCWEQMDRENFRLHFTGSNERQISAYFIDFLKEICQCNPKDINEEIRFRKVLDGEITIRIPINEENEPLIEKVKEKGYHESVSSVKALARYVECYCNVITIHGLDKKKTIEGVKSSRNRNNKEEKVQKPKEKNQQKKRKIKKEQEKNKKPKK